jgi:tetratricopeptide (TPR) repeat protein
MAHFGRELAELSDGAPMIDGIGPLHGKELVAAEIMFAEQLANRRAAGRGEHPDTLTLINNLAHARTRLGKLAEAEPLCQEDLAACRATLGDTHPDTLTSINNYALLLKSMGNFVAAEPLYRESLAARQQYLGESHPSSLASLSNLAALLEAKGDLPEATQLLEQKLKLTRALHGESHRLSRACAATVRRLTSLVATSRSTPPGSVSGQDEGTPRIDPPSAAVGDRTKVYTVDDFWADRVTERTLPARETSETHGRGDTAAFGE